jgi:hypothetical protein
MLNILPLIRYTSNALTDDERRVLGHRLEWYYWLLFALQKAKLSLKRLRARASGCTTTGRGTGVSRKRVRLRASGAVPLGGVARAGRSHDLLHV